MLTVIMGLEQIRGERKRWWWWWCRCWKFIFSYLNLKLMTTNWSSCGVGSNNFEFDTQLEMPCLPTANVGSGPKRSTSNTSSRTKHEFQQETEQNTNSFKGGVMFQNDIDFYRQISLATSKMHPKLWYQNRARPNCVPKQLLLRCSLLRDPRQGRAENVMAVN